MPVKNVIEVARGELSVTELPPNSNKVKYNTEYYGWEVSGPDYKWCVVGLWWVFQHAGEGQAFFGGAKTASCGILRNWYKAQGQTVPKTDGIAGDLAFCNFHGGPLPEHVELIVARKSYGWYQTIGFNTSPGEEGSQDNGGCVALKTRHISQIVEVCRPNYKEEEEMPKTDYSGRWSEAAIRRCIEREIMSGYPDGSFKPTQTITREEAATVADNIVEYILEVIKNG